MCGACGGGGPVRPPWEIDAHGGTLRDHRRRAAEAVRLGGRKVKVEAFGPAGYVVSTLTGVRTIVPDVDALAHELVARLGARVVEAARGADDGPGVTPVAHAVVHAALPPAVSV